MQKSYGRQLISETSSEAPPYSPITSFVTERYGAYFMDRNMHAAKGWVYEGCLRNPLSISKKSLF